MKMILLTWSIYISMERGWGEDGGIIMAKILMIIAKSNFRDEELFNPKALFEEAGHQVIIASSSLLMAKGMRGKSIKPDILHSSINVNDYDVVIFVGGIGAK